MKKVLFVATVTKHINTFHIPYLKWFKEQGYEVHVASNGNEKIEYCDKHYNLPFERFPVKKNNLKTYKELKKIIKENNYSIIHCHTPVGGILTRLAARKARKNGTKVIYTAHGFHFYKGAPLINWIIYYPIEKICARWTDCLITINKEDYELAKKKFEIKQTHLVHGVGVDEKKFEVIITNEEKNKIRKEMNFKEEDFIITYVARMDRNKNHIMIINAMEKLLKLNSNIKLLIVGQDELNGVNQKIVKKKNLRNINFVGFREDIIDLLKCSDIGISTSKREGLGVNLIEEIYLGLPVVALDNRGHREIIQNGKNGYTFYKEKDMIESIIRLTDKNIYQQILTTNKKTVEMFMLSNVMKEMEKIYMEETRK